MFWLGTNVLWTIGAFSGRRARHQGGGLQYMYGSNDDCQQHMYLFVTQWWRQERYTGQKFIPVVLSCRRALRKHRERRLRPYWSSGCRIGEAKNPGPDGADTWTLVTANRSGQGSFVNAAARLNDDVVMGQETMVRSKEAMKQLAKRLKKARRRDKVIVTSGLEGPNSGDSAEFTFCI